MRRKIILTLLEVKNPTVYAEIERKVEGGMKAADAVQDILLEYAWIKSNLCQGNSAFEQQTAPEQQAEFEEAVNAMEGLFE